MLGAAHYAMPAHCPILGLLPIVVLWFACVLEISSLSDRCWECGAVFQHFLYRLSYRWSHTVIQQRYAVTVEVLCLLDGQHRSMHFGPCNSRLILRVPFD